MWKQHAVLLEAELEIVQTELSKARRDIRRLVEMSQAAIDELATLKVAHDALQMEKRRLFVLEADLARECIEPNLPL